MIFEGEFKGGKRHGSMKKYDEEGVLFLEQNFKDDKLDGLKKRYENQELISVTHYEMGEKIK